MCDCLFANVCVCPVCARVRVYAFASACIHVYEFVCLCACCFATGAGVFTSTRLSKLAKGGEIISTTFYKGKKCITCYNQGKFSRWRDGGYDRVSHKPLCVISSSSEFKSTRRQLGFSSFRVRPGFVSKLENYHSYFVKQFH